MSQIIPLIDITEEYSLTNEFPEYGRPNINIIKQVIEFNLSGLILGFLTLSSCGGDQVCWNGKLNFSGYWATPLAKELKKAGKKVVISFGGESNNDISSKLTVKQLISTYINILENYNADQLNFDLVCSGYNIDSICNALKIVQITYPHIEFSFTFQISNINGLNNTNLEEVKKIQSYGILNFIINGNILDCYQSGWNERMGEYSIEITKNIKNQLMSLYNNNDSNNRDMEIYSKIAITPTIGLNFDRKSKFTIQDASAFSSFAKQNNLAFISFNTGLDFKNKNTNNNNTTTNNSNEHPNSEFYQAFVNCN